MNFLDRRKGKRGVLRVEERGTQYYDRVREKNDARLVPVYPKKNEYPFFPNT